MCVVIVCAYGICVLNVVTIHTGDFKLRLLEVSRKLCNVPVLGITAQTRRSLKSIKEMEKDCLKNPEERERERGERERLGGRERESSEK